MQTLSHILDSILGPHSKVSVLRVLFSDAGLTGREVARRAGLSPRAASLALSHLVRIGIVERKTVGGAHQFTVNRERQLVLGALGGLFAEERDLAATIGRQLLEVLGRGACVSIALFGSYARGDAAVDSDLDVLFVLGDSHRIPEARKALEAASGRFSTSFGLRLSPYVIGAAEFVGRMKKGDKLMKAMVREARVIAGKPLAEVIVDES